MATREGLHCPHSATRMLPRFGRPPASCLEPEATPAPSPAPFPLAFSWDERWRDLFFGT